VTEALPDGGERRSIQPLGYVTCFYLYAVIYVLGVFVWLFIDPTKPVVDDDAHATDAAGTSGTASS